MALTSSRLPTVWCEILLVALTVGALAACGEQDNSAVEPSMAEPSSEPEMPSPTQEPEMNEDPDLAVNYMCQDNAWAPGACEAGTTVERDAEGPRPHIAPPEAISYTDLPPTHGAHRPQWAVWGSYEFLPPQRWIHNLEHGGVALLYHPCAPPEIIEELKTLAQGVPEANDGGGPFRWVLTPFADLPSTIAVVTWGKVHQAECVREEEILEFVEANYRQAPEDVARDGSYNQLWLGR